MILGLGTDLVSISRMHKVLHKHGPRFTHRCFTKAERDYAERHEDPESQAATYAKRFAAKEACVKALGTGFVDGIFLRDIEVIHNENNRPELVLSEKLDAVLEELLPKKTTPHFHLSLSDEHHETSRIAMATVILEAR